MLYASCKAAFTSALSNFNLKSDELLSIEVDGPDEVSEESLVSQIHPEVVETKKVETLIVRLLTLTDTICMWSSIPFSPRTPLVAPSSNVINIPCKSFVPIRTVRLSYQIQGDFYSIFVQYLSN